mmetsp:Transcript_41709/g.75749  ORF Transcript_41709/g.75749 Transcript_41709/m.75749 type:complete len:250 (+) Transcript_41709:73-822(+)
MSGGFGGMSFGSSPTTDFANAACSSSPRASNLCRRSCDDADGPSALNRCQSPDSRYFDGPDLSSPSTGAAVPGSASAQDMVTDLGSLWAGSMMPDMGTAVAFPAVPSFMVCPAIMCPLQGVFSPSIGMRMSFGHNFGNSDGWSAYQAPMEDTAGAKFTRRASRAARASEQTNKTRRQWAASSKDGHGASGPVSGEMKAPLPAPIALGGKPSAVVVELGHLVRLGSRDRARARSIDGSRERGHSEAPVTE